MRRRMWAALSVALLLVGVLAYDTAGTAGPDRTLFPTVPVLTTGPRKTESPTPVGPPEIWLDEEDNGSRVELQRGQVLVVRLQCNLSTGYVWQVKEIDEQVVQKLGEPRFEPGSGRPGAASSQLFRFEGVGMGQTPVRLGYQRTWERDAEPARMFVVEVVVR
jgi:inhibitor of cysteine peptidase